MRVPHNFNNAIGRCHSLVGCVRDEKSLTTWAKDRLSELLRGFEVEIPGGTMKVVELTDMKGDVRMDCGSTPCPLLLVPLTSALLPGTRRPFHQLAKGKRVCSSSFTAKQSGKVRQVLCKAEAARPCRRCVCSVRSTCCGSTWVCSPPGELFDKDGNVTGTGDGDLEIPYVDHDTDVSKLEVTVAACSDGGDADRRLAAILKRYGIPTLRKVFASFVEELRQQ